MTTPTNPDALARLRELAQYALTVQYELDDRYLTIIRNGESVVGLLGELATASLALLDRLAAAEGRVQELEDITTMYREALFPSAAEPK